ncbi:cytochrome c-type biogenesis protein CcmH [Carboxydothermus islandicus]|uniref:Cytochrome c-type biogenesis protein n=1 Tax=Carboxydothermus islandicus TaxID=661089 RepID=A0A1L8CZZ6_9THEO|nr:cytochrome c-type biogenesis protein CcmH [Carboxydothermus islandicus]GAV24431.1 cytochrome c-type biogenesis protein CcmH [Carboxydothermus islandicus]
MPLKTIVILTAVILLVLSGFPTLGEVNQDVLNDVIHSFWAPDFCGMNLADCPADSAEEMRNQIKEMLEQGKTKQEIINYYTNLYGTKILAEPPKTGVFAAVWIMPAIAIVAGGVLVYTVVRKRRKEEKVEEKKELPVDDDLSMEVEKELKKYL